MDSFRLSDGHDLQRLGAVADAHHVGEGLGRCAVEDGDLLVGRVFEVVCH